LNQPHPRAWVGRALFVATIALVVLAVALGAVGVVARVDASDQRSRAAPVARALAARVDAQRRGTAELAALRSRADDLSTSLHALLDAIRAQVESANHAVSVANHAADLYNSADVAGATSVLATDRQAALDDLSAKTRAVRDAVTVVQQQTAAFEEASHG
jgi:hypothetical protein